MSGRTDTWMPLFISDYLRDTGHLTTAEHGAYLLLIMQAWWRDGALPADEDRLRIMAKMNIREWRRARGVLLEFFERVGEVYRHKRIDAELERARAMVEQRVGAGKASAEARARHAAGKSTPTESPIEPTADAPTDRCATDVVETPIEKLDTIVRAKTDQNVSDYPIDKDENHSNGRSTGVATEGQRGGRPVPVPTPSKKERGTGLRPVREALLPCDRDPTAPSAMEVAKAGVAVWNEICGPTLGCVVKITEDRKAAFARRFRDYLGSDPEQWRAYCSRVAASGFLTNADQTNRAGWKADFDFVLKEAKMVKILEGTWDRAAERSATAWVFDLPDEPLGFGVH